MANLNRDILEIDRGQQANRMKTEAKLSLANLFVLALAAHWRFIYADDSHDAIIGQQDDRFGLVLRELDAEFNRTAERFVWAKQNESNSGPAKAQVINGNDLSDVKKLCNLFAMISCTRYAIRRKAVGAIRRALANRAGAVGQADTQSPSSNWTSRQWTELLEKRAVFRSLVDGYTFTKDADKRIRSIYAHHNSLASSALAGDINELDEQHTLSAYSAFVEFNQLLDSYAHELGSTRDDSVGIARHLDRTIDTLMGCPNCSELAGPDNDEFDTYPMFASANDVTKLVAELVDEKLLDAIRTSHGTGAQSAS